MPFRTVMEEPIPVQMMREYDMLVSVIPHYLEMQDRLGRAVGEYAAGRDLEVVELGYGTGITTEHILQHYSGRLTAVDILDLEDMARERVPEDRVTFVTADCLDHLASLPPSSIDIVASSALIHNFWPETRRQVLQGIYDVLRPGGMFANSDKYPCDDPMQHAEDLEWELARLSTVGDQDLFGKWREHYLTDERRPMRESEALQQLRDIGFVRAKRLCRHRMQALVVAFK